MFKFVLRSKLIDLISCDEIELAFTLGFLCYHILNLCSSTGAENVYPFRNLHLGGLRACALGRAGHGRAGRGEAVMSLCNALMASLLPARPRG